MVTERRPTKDPRKAAKKAAVKSRAKAKKPFDALGYLLKMSEKVPEEELARMPRDLAYNFDHYHDGSPKQR